MKKTVPIQEADVMIDHKDFDMEGYNGPEAVSKKRKHKTMAATRSNDGLDKVKPDRFIIRHTDKDVHLAYFNIGREAEKIARKHSNEWF